MPSDARKACRSPAESDALAIQPGRLGVPRGSRYVHDFGQVAAHQRLSAGQEHPLHPGQAGADGVKLIQRRVALQEPALKADIGFG